MRLCLLRAPFQHPHARRLTPKVFGLTIQGVERLKSRTAAARCAVDGAAALYGLGISEHLDELDRVTCRLQLHYGLRDQHVPRQEIDTVAASVRGRPAVEVFLSPGAGHSFANPVRPTYDPAAAKLAGERIEAMLRAM